MPSVTHATKGMGDSLYMLAILGSQPDILAISVARTSGRWTSTSVTLGKRGKDWGTWANLIRQGTMPVTVAITLQNRHGVGYNDYPYVAGC